MRDHVRIRGSPSLPRAATCRLNSCEVSYGAGRMMPIGGSIGPKSGNTLVKARLLLCIALVWLIPSLSRGDSVRQSARHVPIVREVDIVVVGGTVGAVAAATEAADDGASVLLLVPRTYLGEDLCAGLRLWLEPEKTPQGELTRRLFPSGKTTTPMRVKQTLEAALLEAGVEVLLACYPTDVLAGEDGYAAGLLIANRAGRQAVAAKLIIDATDRAVVAKMAGAECRPWSEGKHRCTRVVLGGKATGGTEPSRTVRAGVELDGKEVLYYEYALELDLGDGGVAALAEAEQTARELTYRDGQLRAAERLWFVPSDAVMGQVSRADWDADSPTLGHFIPRGFSRLYVLGGSADIPRTEVDRVLCPTFSEAIGRRVGRAATSRARQIAVPERLRPISIPDPTDRAGDVREILTGLRSTSSAGEVAALPDTAVPILTNVEIVIVGGGASGACAAIAAARRGADVLLIEYQEGLGGVGTMGLIGRPYHGRNLGFTKEVPFCDKQHNTEFKMEWFRREIRKAGGQIWFGSLGAGAFVDGNRVKGVVVATPLGRGVVLADVVIDATGNADIAIAAGADYMYGGDGDDIALQGTGLPMRPLSNSYVNTDYLLVDESDMVDVSRALLGMRMAAEGTKFDFGTFIQTRERRRVVGRHVLSYLDQIAGRTYPDSVVFSGSDYDSHGYPSEPYFALIPHTKKTLKANHPAPGGNCYTPYRSMLPQTLDGILVIGLGISMHRDASAMVRMQKDMHNQGYAAGVAATMAVQSGRPPHQIDVRALQEHLVEIGNLPESVLTDGDSFPLSDDAVRSAVEDLADAKLNRVHRCRALAIVLSHGGQAQPMLKSKLDSSADDVQLTYAKTLAFVGDKSGVQLLIEELRRVDAWDAKILQGNMAEYAHLATPVDALILGLGYSGDRRALPVLLGRLDTLDEGVTLSHHRAVALALESIRDPSAAPAIARLLERPGMRGHAMLELEPLYDKEREKRRRTGPLREIVWARALYRCGDCDGLGERILEEYRNDIRGLFARHAAAVLEQNGR